jgi:hypothetical protein
VLRRVHAEERRRLDEVRRNRPHHDVAQRGAEQHAIPGHQFSRPEVIRDFVDTMVGGIIRQPERLQT